MLCFYIFSWSLYHHLSNKINTVSNVCIVVFLKKSSLFVLSEQQNGWLRRNLCEIFSFLFQLVVCRKYWRISIWMGVFLICIFFLLFEQLTGIAILTGKCPLIEFKFENKIVYSLKYFWHLFFDCSQLEP